MSVKRSKAFEAAGQRETRRLTNSIREQIPTSLVGVPETLRPAKQPAGGKNVATSVAKALRK